jgi:IPT/TIG domain
VFRARGVVLGGVCCAMLAGIYGGAMAPLPVAAAGLTVTGVAPAAGPSAGGTSIVIAGSGFTGATAVVIGANTLTPCPTAPGCFTFVSDTEIDATTPPGTAGTSDVQVVVGVPSPTNAPADYYTYLDPPTVKTVASPQNEGATGIAVTGAHFSIPGPPVTAAVSEVDLVPTNNATGPTVKLTAVCASPGQAGCLSFADDSDLSINLPASMASGNYDTEVITPGGTSATSSSDLIVVQQVAPTVISVSPNAGPAGGGPPAATIHGTDFIGSGFTTSAVSFGAIAATAFTVNTSSSITATPPAGSGQVDITVTTQSTDGTSTQTSATSSVDTYAYAPVPAVSNVVPGTGPTGGGNAVTLTGTGFQSNYGAGANYGATEVTIGTHIVPPCPGPPSSPCFTVTDTTHIGVANFPPHAAGTVDITVTTPGGTSAANVADQYTYEPIPTVSGVSPIAGVVAGGNTVIVTGTLFLPATEVSVGGTNIITFPCGTSPTAPCFTVDNDTQITIEDFPSGSAGTVNITVTTPGGTSPTSAADVYAYAPIPTVTKVSPNHGSINGGASVTLTGTGFEPAGTNRNFTTTAVTVGGVAITSSSSPCPGAPTGPCYNVNSSTQIFIEDFPANTAAGSVDITVTTVGGTSTTSTADKYFYGATFPTVTLLSQKYGAEKGGALLTITGTNFSSSSGISVSDVFFGATDVPASDAYPCLGATAGCFTVVSPTQISAYTPAGSVAGAVDVTVTTTIGTSGTSAADQYTYVASGAYTALTPFRICDTRASRTPDECTGKTLATGGRLTVQITGIAAPNLQVVPSGAEAVVVNLTAINHSSTITYVTAFPAGSVPVASNMNLDPRAVQSDLAIVQLTPGGAITLYNAVGSLDAIVDVEGFFAAPPGSGSIPGEFHSIAPSRMCDTRANHGTACAGATNDPLPANTWRKVVLSGTGSIPASGAAAAVFNLTATQGTQATYLSVAPPNGSDQCPTGAQGASNLNPKAGGSLPNRVISPLGPANDVCIYNAVGSIEFIIDVDGWFGTGSEPSAGALFYSVPPTRICDTRAGTGTRCAGRTLLPNFTEVVQVAGVTAVPAFVGAQPVAMVANLTGVAGTQSTYLELYPSDAHKPVASDLNPTAHDVIANLAIVGLAQIAGATWGSGDVNLYNGLGTINAIVDVAGWYQ